MGRKYRATEISGNMNIPQRGGQYKHSNYLCVNCNCFGGKHYPECTKTEVYEIPSSAEVPTKNSSKRKWDIFKKQFVYSKPKGYWFSGNDGWWYREIFLKELQKRNLEIRWGIIVKKENQ
jgi:hypothetical protein